jgi:small-conductance mechanosensitive channel
MYVVSGWLTRVKTWSPIQNKRLNSEVQNHFMDFESERFNMQVRYAEPIEKMQDHLKLLKKIEKYLPADTKESDRKDMLKEIAAEEMNIQRKIKSRDRTSKERLLHKLQAIHKDRKSSERKRSVERQMLEMFGEL